MEMNACFQILSPWSISLQGDILILRREIDENWYEASLDDRTGIIPAPYITIFDDDDDNDQQ